MAEKGSKEREIGLEEGDHIFDGVDFYVLPEGCIAAVISFTSPRDACRLAAVSKIFKSAADSDSVWERFLPSDYADILARSDGSQYLCDSLSKKDLFVHLVRRQLLIDGSTKSFSLERSTGKKCYGISPRDLAITWGDTPRYWSWYSVSDTRFSEVAELITVCWLEIRGKIKASMLSPDTKYGAYFVFKVTEAVYGFYSPVEVAVKTAGGKTETRKVYLDPQQVQNQRQIVRRRIGIFYRIHTAMTVMQPDMQREGDGKLPIPKQREDGWMEVEIGEFFTRRGEEGDVEISVLEVEGGNWKGGLLVEGIDIRPKGAMQ